jgi:hypothetical protein
VYYVGFIVINKSVAARSKCTATRKGKGHPFHTIKTDRERGGLASHIPDLGTGWRHADRFCPGEVTPGTKNSNRLRYNAVFWVSYSRRFEGE